ncbi:MAG: purine-binding chemotaxis protein CheW [Gammaproteobacteria bacterium]|nr:MAG: purine-binding chemotaxis protein CheW [Gammaproteobacteria bacterium]TND06751.1 MAG: purine-binding chemotaxis protein CheW [Gammaproteobacteria bacterium]
MESVRQETKRADTVTQWVTFRLAGETYGIEVMSVQEVLRVPEITPVPGVPDHVLGIINLRGKVVTVLDMRQRFGLPSTGLDDASRIIVIEIADDVVGVLVDRVAEVVYLNEAEVESAPDVGNRKSSRFIRGVHVSDDQMLILVDFTGLIDEA